MYKLITTLEGTESISFGNLMCFVYNLGIVYVCGVSSITNKKVIIISMWTKEHVSIRIIVRF